MRFRILGPLEVWHEGRRLAVGGPQQRALLSVLLLHANRVVSSDRLIDYLWSERPPPTVRNLLQGCVSGLRRMLKDGERQPLLTRPPGYLLEVRAGELDVDRFTELERSAAELAAGGSAAGLEQAAALLTEALSLWRGPPLDDISTVLDTLRAETTQLEERRLAALEDLVEVELRLGRHAKLVGELPPHIQAHPLRERLWAQLMLALYGADRQADALDAYRRLRETLAGEIGVEPGSTVRRLQQDILAGTDALERYLRIQRPDPPTRQGETVRAAPAQLPAAPSAFTGRARQLKALDELLCDPGTTLPVGLITGTAGVGKTALALHWAHQVRERFPDGQLYVDLRGYASAPTVRPVAALAGLLRALGLPGEEVPTDLEAAAGLYRTVLAGRRTLVVLDNADSVEQVRPLLPGSATCLALVTSRARLAGLVARDGARPIVLDVLDPGEATALLGRVLGHERVAAEPAAAGELARVCALLPLALRIAAANLVFQPGRRLADQVAELSAGDRLSGLAVAGDERSAVRLAFDLSYAALDPAARRLFRLLGLVPGPDATAEAAAALAALSAPEAERLLERLAGAHLIARHAGGRYAFHDLLRIYAAERASVDAERAAAVTRLYDWYLSNADAAVRLLYPDKLRLRAAAGHSATFDDHAEALSWLDQERSNLTAAARENTGRYAWLLADALRGYSRAASPPTTGW